MHANLCMHILASPCQDGGNPFPVIRLPVVNSVTDSSRHMLRLPALHSQWSRQVYIIHRSITGFLVVQEPTCTHAHEYRLLGASCFFFGVTFVHANLCQPANFYNYSKKELQRKTIFFSQVPAGIELATSEFEDQCLIHWTTAVSLEHLGKN